ncbi:hypothetical protein GCM10025865_32420 [Paraoerskovia sediminicola]|uniref:Ribonuclease n=1 Tax=Paraoerskovia sediminicola TaxID=1138587 RepID=A0ABM8G773_9CELL|nr:ribonuclease HII [Paraoerskovia sediminicola]BDZ43943.1 hypothetical protein GCM10025865_32420 [Paraoerskovia sediminicola]
MTGRPAAVRAPRRRPDLRVERGLLRDGALLVAGMDEVGRGALAGPVSVGVVVVDARTRPCPPGLADSKLLTPRAREALVAPTRRWGVCAAVGHAGADEIDAIGIIAALRTAGLRALDTVTRAVGAPDVVLLDGSHDWLSAPADLFSELDGDGPPAPRVRTLVKADLRCASVAAASVLAKCERDAMLVELSGRFPAYRWDLNKGYASAEHTAAIRQHGTTDLHRRSWRLPGAPADVSVSEPVCEPVSEPVDVPDDVLADVPVDVPGERDDDGRRDTLDGAPADLHTTMPARVSVGRSGDRGPGHGE